MLGLSERFVGSPLGRALLISLSDSPCLGHHLSGPGGLGPGGAIGPPLHTGLLDYNSVRLALNLFCSRPVHDSYGVRDVVAPSLGIGVVGAFARFQAEYVSSR